MACLSNVGVDNSERDNGLKLSLQVERRYHGIGLVLICFWRKYLWAVNGMISTPALPHWQQLRMDRCRANRAAHACIMEEIRQ
jgi:hypothetical protein